VRLVAEQLAQDGAAPSGAELDAADLVGVPAPVPGGADGEVLDAVPVQVSGGDDHPPVELARLAARPVAELLPGGAGVDEHLPGERPCLILRGGCCHHDLALAVAVEISDRGHDPAEAAPAIRSLPVVQLLAAGRRKDP